MIIVQQKFKNMKKVLFFFVAILFVTTSFAQVNEVTLTVIGTGPTEEKATLQALRSAIEQSFGAFVSANTTILNDRLVQDEIVSVSNGNVKEYQKLAVATLSNGQVSVSAKVTVSVNKLISYAKSKGSRAEFAGQTYAANVKLTKLRAASAEKAYSLMVQQLELLAKDMFDFELSIGDPELFKINGEKRYKFPCKIKIYSNIASTNFYNLYTSTINNLELSSNEIELFKKEDIKFGNINIHWRYDSSSNRNFQKSQYDIVDFYKCWVPIEYPQGVERKYLPIAQDKLNKYDDRIRSAIFNALKRYKINEINNPHNSYEFIPNKNLNVCWGYNEQNINKLTYNGEKSWYSRKFQENVHYYDRGTSKRNIYKAYIFPLISRFSMTEKRTPMKLTKEQQKAIKKGTYTGPTYTVSYVNPQVLWTDEVYVGINASEIEKCKGFELQ